MRSPSSEAAVGQDTVELQRDPGGLGHLFIPGHRESLAGRAIVIDCNPSKGEGVLPQIFTQNVIGPIFLEIIQRKGNEGFGEGSFRALFESIELDPMRRGVLQAPLAGALTGRPLGGPPN
jgi:hypothetical protein